MTKQTEALKLADELDSEFAQGRISNHTGRKAAQMLRALAQPEQEPVAWIYEDELPESYPYDEMFENSRVIDGVRMFPVNVAPQRTWVELTEDEIQTLLSQNRFAVFALIRAVEAKLKEKNT